MNGASEKKAPSLEIAHSSAIAARPVRDLRGEPQGRLAELACLLRLRSASEGMLVLSAAALLPFWGAFAAPDQILVSAALSWILLALAICDFRDFILPDILTFALAAVGLAAVAFGESNALFARMGGMAIGGGSLWAAGALYRALRGREGLGMGDVKLLAAGGAWITLEALPTALLVGSCAALLYGLAIARGGARDAGGDPLPFGAFLCLGLWVAWLYGPIDLLDFLGSS